MANGLIGKVTAGGGTHLIASTAYFTCATAGGTAAKIAKAADTSLNSLTVITGMTIYVKFDAANTKANPTLTLQTNGGTQLLAAKPIMRYGTTATHTNAAGSWKSGAVVALTYDGTNWVEVSSLDDNNTYYYESCYVSTAAETAAKVGTCSNYALQKGYLQVLVMNANSSQSALTLNINSTGAKPIYINGTASSTSNYTLPKAMYLVYYDGTNFYFRTDGALTASGSGAAYSTAANGALTFGTLPVAQGGTGATSAADAWTALGGGASGKHADSYFAKASHGNHVPATQTANNAIFLRNDNTWQTVTPANIGAATSDHDHDNDYVNVSGDTMTGGLTLSNGSSAYNDKGLLFTNGSRIGENGGGDLGIYAADGLYIKPSSPTASSSTEGIRITSNGLYPCVNNTELLGLSDNKWSNVYATTFTGNLNGASNANIYLTSATAAGTAAKTASYTGFSLLTGSSIYIKFDKTNTAESPTLNIEGTGAKEIWYKGAIVKYQGIATGITYHMMYDGSKWQIINNIIPQMVTCTSGANAGTKSVTCPGFILYTGATIKIKFSNTNTNIAAKLSVNSTGAKPINWIGATNDLAHRLVENHIYEFVYDGTNYNIVAPIARHYATSGAAPVMYTQQDYDNYVDLHGGPPTWAVGDTKTEAVDGIETLALGNSTDYHMAGGLRGRILLYGAGSTNYTTIYAQANGTNTVYLPNYNGAMHLIHAGDNNAVGTSSKPVYVAANGRVTQCSTIGSVTNEVWNVNFS